VGGNSLTTKPRFAYHDKALIIQYLPFTRSAEGI
jgi:hypothetical protein